MTSNRPEWTSKLIELYEAGIASGFILHFNINDYVSATYPLPVSDYLSNSFSKSRNIIAFYSRDKGITFPLESMKQKAIEALGLDDNSSSPDSALSALQSVGLASPSDNTELPKDPTSAIPLLDQLLRAEEDILIIMEDIELILPDSDLATMQANDRTMLSIVRKWARDMEIGSLGNIVVLTTNNLSSIHSELKTASNRYESILIPLPKFEERKAFIEKRLSSSGKKLDLNGLTVEAISNATSGLSLLHIEDILLRGERIGKLHSSFIWDRKEDIIKAEFGEVLEVIEPNYSFDDIGGLEYIKTFFKRNIINPILKGNKNRVPMGILMTGPPGTGKSIFAEGIAKEAGLNAVKLRIGGQIASKWQGEGERNLEKALSAIVGLAPTIVFIDEIDQAISRGENSSSQQDQRIFQRLLEFMSETNHRGDIVFLGATNRPDLMDSALRRAGRFDKKIPFLIPDPVEREAIFKVMVRRYLKKDIYDLSAKRLFETVANTEGWTGAEIESAVIKAIELIEDEDLNLDEALLESTYRLSPSTSDIELMTMLAIKECNDKDLLPPQYKNELDQREELDNRIEGAKAYQRKSRKL